MQKIGSSTTTADENDEFTDGDPQTQVPCTWVMAAWLNTLQRELVHLCEEAGITIDPEDDTQVYQAIAQLLNTSTEGMVKTVNEHQPDEHGNVKLGSAADADITTSSFDTVLGHLLKVGDYGFGIGNGSSKLLTSIYDITCTGIYNVMGKGTQSPTEGVPADSGNTRYSAFALNIYAGQYWVALFSSTEFYIGQVKTTDNTSSWSRYYNTSFKQTAADTGAMPYFGTALNVDLNTLGAYSAAGVHYQPTNAGATTANHYPVAEAGALLVLPSAYGCQQEYTTFGTGRKFLRGLSGAWNGTNGPWGNWNELYGPTNPNEIVSTSEKSYRIAYNGYGTFWLNDGVNFYLMLTNNGDPYGNYNSLRPLRVSVATGEAVMHKLNLEDFGYFDARYNAKYPAQFRVGARVTYNGSDFFSHVPQGAVNINNMTDGDDRINGVQYAYLQYNLNGNWVNFA